MLEQFRPLQQGPASGITPGPHHHNKREAQLHFRDNFGTFCSLQLPYISSETQQENTHFVEGLETGPNLLGQEVCGIATNYVPWYEEYKDPLLSSTEQYLHPSLPPIACHVGAQAHIVQQHQGPYLLAAPVGCML